MRHFIFICLLTFVFTKDVYAQKGYERPASQTDTVFVMGLVKQPMAISMNNLWGLPVQKRGKHIVADMEGKTKSSMSNFKGILLKEIIVKAGVELNHKEQGKYYIVITATDGYEVIFAYNEIMYGAAAKGTFLATEIDRRPVKNGPFVLLSTSDEISGPRHVKWVKTIEVRKI